MSPTNEEPQDWGEKADQALKTDLSRRSFLKLVGASAAGLVLPPGSLGGFPEQARVSEGEIVGERISGVETWGAKEPLNQNQLATLIKRLNAKYQKEGGDKTLRPDGYYVTFFMPTSVYKNFPSGEWGDDVQTFLVNNVTGLDSLLKNGDPPIDGGMILRRLIVVEDDADCPVSHHLGYLTDGLRDSDGVWRICDPRRAYYWDGKCDREVIHELGHSVLHFPDHYSLDFYVGFIGDLPSVLRIFPRDWQRYITNKRNDFGDDLMRAGYPALNSHELLQLHRRIQGGWTHDFRRKLQDYLVFPDEMPANIVFSFGEGYQNAKVEIYRTETINWQKRLKRLSNLPIEVYQTNKEGKAAIKKPFMKSKDYTSGSPEGKLMVNGIAETEAVLFLKVTTSGGEPFGRWLDIGDFNIPKWQGYDRVTMAMNLFSPETDPATFDWTIKYS